MIVLKWCLPRERVRHSQFHQGCCPCLLPGRSSLDKLQSNQRLFPLTFCFCFPLLLQVHGIDLIAQRALITTTIRKRSKTLPPPDLRFPFLFLCSAKLWQALRAAAAAGLLRFGFPPGKSPISVVRARLRSLLIRVDCALACCVEHRPVPWPPVYWVMLAHMCCLLWSAAVWSAVIRAGRVNKDGLRRGVPFVWRDKNIR